MAEQAAIAALQAISKLPSGQALEDLHGQVSSAMHTELEKSPIPERQLPDYLHGADVCKFNYDEGHIGRFTVFGTQGASVSLEDVLDRRHPLKFIREKLTTGEPRTSREVVIFSPGLDTPHERRRGVDSIPSPERVIFYSKMMGGIPMAQLHTGTCSDQGPAELDVSDAPVLRGLMFFLENVGGMEEAKPNEKGEIVLSAKTIDYIQVALSHFDIEDNRLKQSMGSLLELASPEEPIVLMPYSRGTIELASALRSYRKKHEEAGSSAESISRHLRASVTVVSICNASHEWPDGPAYIHVGSYKDSLTDAMGCHAGKQSGGGADAIFLTCDSPYNDFGNESHNFASVVGQFLSVIMIANKTNSFRRLYELAHEEGGDGDEVRSRGIGGRIAPVAGGFIGRLLNEGDGEVGGGRLVVPANILELTRAMIRMTGGLEFCWSPVDKILEGMDEIPEMGEAVELLKEHLDGRSIDEIRARCAED